MRIIVTGGSGFIGRHLISALVADGHTITVLTRAHWESGITTSQGLLRYVHWNPLALESGLVELLSGADAVINLAGANIGSRRWTKRRKADLLNSRVSATETLVSAIERLEASRRPRTLVNASGIDFYGNCYNEVLTEGSEPGDTFLSQVCERWEQAAIAAQPLGVRVVLMRTAVVLAKDALTLHLMALPFRLFLGGPIGDGQQWFPWIHIDDIVGLYSWVLSTPSIAGPVNAVAPDVRMQAQVAQALGSVLSRPHRLRAPVAALRLLMGEQADLLLHGCRAVPEQALAHGYAFRFPELVPALHDCLHHDAAEKVTPLGLRSPFFPVLGGVAEDLPEVLRDQYLVQPGDPYRVVLEGTMDRVWHRPFWLWPFLRLLAIFDILFPEQGNNIEASMVVEGQPGRQGGGAQTWYRTFRFNRPRRFNATMLFDQRLARVVERLEPFGILEAVWNVTFEPPDTIRIGTESIRVGVDRCRMVLPRWVSVEVEVSETALLDRNGTIAVALVIRQPWLGEIFGYTGRFQVRKEEKKSQKS